MFGHFERMLRLTLAGSLLAIGCGGTAMAAAEAGSLVIKVVELNSWYRAVLVEREATRNPRDLEALAKPLCEGLTVCRVGVWTDQWSTPHAMPIRAPQLEAQEYAFGRNPEGVETSLWNCNKYPEFEAEQLCLPRVLRR